MSRSTSKKGSRKVIYIYIKYINTKEARSKNEDSTRRDYAYFMLASRAGGL